MPNWYDLHACNYDPALGMWFNPDPMMEKYHSFSPNSYCLNNPVNVVDPAGMFVFKDTNKLLALIDAYLNFNGIEAFAITDNEIISQVTESKAIRVVIAYNNTHNSGG